MSLRLPEADRWIWKPDSDALARLQSLTERHKLVLHLLTSGLGNKQIAYCLDIAEATVKAHVSAVYERIGARNRVQAALFWLHVAGVLDVVVAEDADLRGRSLAREPRLASRSEHALPPPS